MILVLYYGLLIALAILSFLMIRENAWVGVQGERLFNLKKGTFYRRKLAHSLYVAAMKWPAFLALIGLIIPTPLIWDTVLGFLMGSAYQLYRWTKAKADVAVQASPESA